MENKNKIILDLAGGTGAWSKPYEKAGYDVRLVTLPGQDVRTYIPPENVYGILAAPPLDLQKRFLKLINNVNHGRENLENNQNLLKKL